MFFIYILCAAVVLGFLLYRRLQRGAYLLGGVMEAAPQVRAAAKRLGFHAQPNVHSIVSIHTADLCVAAMASAFAQMDDHGAPVDEVLTASLQKRLQADPQAAADMTVLGGWLVEQGGGVTPAFERLTNRLKQLDHGPYFDKLMRVMGDVTAAGTKGMPSARQADAMGALARIFRTA